MTTSTENAQHAQAAAIDQMVARWSSMPSPIRPSPEDQALWRDAVRADAPRPGAEVLLLGSTPELRDIVHELSRERGLDLRLTGCDIDELFWRAMTRLCRDSSHESRERETFIHGDWLELPARGRFDLVLGDGSLNMLGWDAMTRMVPKLAAHLRPRGRAVLRVQTYNPALGLDTLERAIAEYPGERADRAFLLSIHFLVESLRSAQYPELSNREFYRRVAARFLKPEELARLLPLTRDKRNFYPSEAAVESLLAQHLDIASRTPCSGPRAWGTAKLYVLTPRTP